MATKEALDYSFFANQTKLNTSTFATKLFQLEYCFDLDKNDIFQVFAIDKLLHNFVWFNVIFSSVSHSVNSVKFVQIKGDVSLFNYIYNNLKKQFVSTDKEDKSTDDNDREQYCALFMKPVKQSVLDEIYKKLKQYDENKLNFRCITELSLLSHTDENKIKILNYDSKEIEEKKEDICTIIFKIFNDEIKKKESKNNDIIIAIIIFLQKMMIPYIANVFFKQLLNYIPKLLKKNTSISLTEYVIIREASFLFVRVFECMTFDEIIKQINKDDWIKAHLIVIKIMYCNKDSSYLKNTTDIITKDNLNKIGMIIDKYHIKY